jgi:epsilon-lactone hydrolase
MSEPSAKPLAFPAAAEAIELRHLRTFVAVAEELNFGRAAERLYVTQPAVSRQIRLLEQLVGCELLRRSTRQVELTLAGEALLERARRLLADVDEAVTAAQAVGGEIMARIAGLWQIVGEHLGRAGDLEAQRAASEALLANFEAPERTRTRAVNTNGVPGLVVGTGPTAPPNMLFVHGGSYVLGSAYGYPPLAGALATASETDVLIPDYRLAPEHPFPAALDDVHTAYSWLLEQDVDPRKLIVAGDSNGAAITLALLLRCRDEGIPLPAGAVLLCPAPSIEADTVRADPDGPFETMVRAFWKGCTDSYLAGHPADDPFVSPLLGDLTDLPPLLIQAGAHDLLLTEARALHERAQACGVPSELELYPAAAHSFHLFWSFLPEAIDALDAAGTFCRERLSGARSTDSADPTELNPESRNVLERAARATSPTPRAS